MFNATGIAVHANELNVGACFGIPGSGASFEFIDGLKKQGIPFYLSHFEGSAALMASTFGRINGGVGVSASIKGPGLVNALPGIATAWFEDFPLVHVAEATPVTAPPWVAHKRVAQQNMAAPVIKGYGRISSVSSHLKSAIQMATPVKQKLPTK